MKEKIEEKKEIKYNRIFKVDKERNKEKEDDEDSDLQFISCFTPMNSQIQRGERGSYIKMEHHFPIPFYYPVMVHKNIEQIQRVQDQPRKIQKISENMDILQLRSDEVDSQINHSTFDLDLANRYTRKNLFIELIKMHNSKNYENCECLGLNRNQQKEFITLLMRYGLKDNTIEPLYLVAESMKDSKKKMAVCSVSKDTFVMYGKNIIEFIEFLMLDSKFRSTPHFILNGNTAQNVKYCIQSVHNLSKIFSSARNRVDNLLFNGSEEYLENVRDISQNFNWTYQDDFNLLSWVYVYGFQNYKCISNSQRWLKTNSKIIGYAEINDLNNDLLQVIYKLDYKMPWECLFERVFDFDIIKARRILFQKDEIKDKMITLKKQLEKFLSERVKFILDFYHNHKFTNHTA